MKRMHSFTVSPFESYRDALRAYVAAAITYKEARRLRRVLIHSLVVVGCLMWFVLEWPSELPDGVGRMARLSWLAGAIAGLCAAAFEWISYRRLMRCLSRLGGPFEDGAGPSDDLERST